MTTIDQPPTPNRAARRAEQRAGGGAPSRRSRKIAAVGSSVVLAASAAAVFSADSAGAATIVVTSTADSGAGSLRDALANANDGDIIDLTALSGTIVLASELAIDDAVTITGPGASTLTISGNDAVRVFHMNNTITGAQTVTITGVTIADGEAGGNAGGGIRWDCQNANNNSLVLDGVVVVGNNADALGGGLYFDRCGTGDFIISNSVVSNNTTSGSSGGGIWFDDSDQLIIINSTIAGNTAAQAAGGIIFDNGGELVIRNSTISGNNALGSVGGGLYLNDASAGATIANSTFAGNTADDNGGGIAVSNSDITLLQTTISGNTATNGIGDGLYLQGGVSGDDAGAQGDNDITAQDAGVVIITGTIIAGNADGTDDVASYYGGEITAAFATATSDHSVFGTVNGVDITDTGGTQVGVTNPGLGALAFNGGPTQTMALLTGSPAINTGPVPVPTFPGNEFDQRGTGFARVVDGVVDVGAYEVQPPPVIVIVPAFTG